MGEEDIRLLGTITMFVAFVPDQAALQPYEESLAADKQACHTEQEISGAPPPLPERWALVYRMRMGPTQRDPPPYDESAADGVAAARPWQDAQRQSQEC